MDNVIKIKIFDQDFLSACRIEVGSGVRSQDREDRLEKVLVIHIPEKILEIRSSEIRIDDKVSDVGYAQPLKDQDRFVIHGDRRFFVHGIQFFIPDGFYPCR
jgi:hypothetical protein